MTDTPSSLPQWSHAEPVPIDVVLSDGCDLEALHQFTYSPVNVASPSNHVMLDCKGCCCSDGARGGDEAAACAGRGASGCSCLAECRRGCEAMQAHGRAAQVTLLLECGPACSCSSSTSQCPARPTQQGVRVQLALHWCQLKGWCVRAAQGVAQGTFVAAYGGEYVSSREARRRLAAYDQQQSGHGHALMVVRLQLPSGTSSLCCCIDATRTGNVARFINHSCGGGNLEPVIVQSCGSLLLRVALFAAREIAAGEELSFEYACSSADASQGAPPGLLLGCSQRPCHCGSAACSGFLPSAAV